MRTRLTITLKDSILKKIDTAVDGVKLRNRSHAIEYYLNKSFYSAETQAVVLAGGAGARMRPYTYEMPKSLLPLKDKPLLEYSINLLKNSGIKDVILLTGRLGNKIRESFGDGSRFGIQLEYSEEKNPLGTGGALRKAQGKIKSSPFLVIHGDIVTDIDVKELLAYHQDLGNIVTIALKPLKDTRAFGQISLKGHLVTEFHRNKQAREKNLVNTGVYVCNQEIFNYFPKKTKFNFEDVLAELSQRKFVSGYVFDSMWFDVGTNEDYSRAIKALR